MRRSPTALAGCAVLAAALCLAPPLRGEERTLTLDPAATRIAFTLGATLHTVEGTARLVSGELRFDAVTGAASGRLVVDARSAATGNAKRDRDMHQKVLESETYPEIAFTAERFAGELAASGASRIELRGSLEIYGATHPLTLAAEVAVDGGRLTARTTFTVPYVAWGMRDPSKFLLRVAKEVEVTVEAVGELG